MVTSGLSRKAGGTRHDDSITTSPIRNALLHATFALNRAAMHPSRSISATPVPSWPQSRPPPLSPVNRAVANGHDRGKERVFPTCLRPSSLKNVTWKRESLISTANETCLSFISSPFFFFFSLATLHLASQLKIVRASPDMKEIYGYFFFFSHLYNFLPV